MRAGFGKWELTPPMGVELSGYGYYLGRRAESVNDPLFARALMLETEDMRALVISCELLGLNRTICSEVAQHAAQYGIAADHVMIVSVHTHTGPSAKYHEGCGYVDDRYVATVSGLVNHAVDLAYADLAEVTKLSHMSSPLPGDYIYNRTLKDGPVDRAVRGFTFERADKPPIAAVSTACHCVFRRCITAVSADYAGEINRLMEQKGMECLFLNGACGDIDPYQPTPERLDEFAKLVTDIFSASAHPLPLTLQAGAIPYTLRLTPVDAKAIKASAQGAVERAGGESEPAARVALVWRDEMLEKVDELAFQEDIAVKYLLLGGVPVVALPFEAYTVTGQIIRETISRPDALTLGTAEELLGYLPSKEDIIQGSYAATDSPYLYKRLPPLPGEAERLGEELGAALKKIPE